MEFGIDELISIGGGIFGERGSDVRAHEFADRGDEVHRTAADPRDPFNGAIGHDPQEFVRNQNRKIDQKVPQFCKKAHCAPLSS